MARNAGFAYVERLPAGVEGTTLLDYLSARWRHSSRESWAARIEAGRVLLDGGAARRDARLRRGGTLTWVRPAWDEPEAPDAIEVLHEDDDVLAVAKPAGLPTLPGAGFLLSTLLSRVRGFAGDAAPAHRLGRWTSGVVLFGRTAAARADVSAQFAARGVRKRYRTLASGTPRSDRLTVTTPIGRVPHRRLGTVHAAAPDGKPAFTDVLVLERRGDAFLCEVGIATGRPHQIRIHLAAAGHPLVGDPLYAAGGGVAPDCDALPGDPGYLLHAVEIAFRHPRDGRPMAIACAPPEALALGGSAPAAS